MYLRPHHPCALLFLVMALGLFFGLFFGLNYPEIVRHGWPLSQCTVLDANIETRYCCETSCDNSGCASAPALSPGCGSLVSQIDSGYSPSVCAANSSACPPNVGSICDGGYYCCNTCCSTCTSCTSQCSGNTCSQSCTTYSCNCYCCDSTSHLRCTLSCPICFDVDLGLSYQTKKGVLVNNITYVQDFKKDNNSAVAFFKQHLANSTSYCHYNPKDVSQVTFDVQFTTWKWVITAIFGILPLVAFLGFYFVVDLLIPGWNIVSYWARDGYREATQSGRGRYGFLAATKRDQSLYSPTLVAQDGDKEDKRPPSLAFDLDADVKYSGH